MQDIDALITVFESQDLIPRETVLACLSSNDLAAKGVVFAYLEKVSCVARISPSLTSDQFDASYLNYLKECILKDSEDDLVHSRYEATWALASWFKLAMDKDKEHPRLIELRKWLGDTYKATPSLRDSIINGFLEHVISLTSATAFFSVWKSDRELQYALQQARLWNAR